MSIQKNAADRSSIRNGNLNVKKILWPAAFVLACVAGVLVYFRFFSITDAPDAKELTIIAYEDLSCVYLGDGYSFCVLSPSQMDPKAAVSSIMHHARRFDVAVLLDCSEEGLALARVFIGNCSCKTLLVPRATPKSMIEELSGTKEGLTIRKIPYRKGVICGDLLLYDSGRSGALALSVTHGQEKLLHAAAPSGGRFSLAFSKGEAVLASSFVTESCFIEDSTLDYSKSKVQTMAITPIPGEDVFYLDGGGEPKRFSQLMY